MLERAGEPSETVIVARELPPWGVRGQDQTQCVYRSGQQTDRPPSAAPAGEGGRVARSAQRVLVPPRSRRAAGGTHMLSTARALRRRRLGRAIASRGRLSARSSHRDRDAPPAANAWAARRAPSTSAGWGGRSRRAGGTARARPAAIATRRRRHKHGPHGVCPPPAPAGGGDRVAPRACSSPCNRDALPGTHTWAADSRAFHQRRLGRAVASRGRLSACSSRRDRGMPRAAHTWAARRLSSVSAGWGGR
jgi:hypothetical protein